MNNKWVYVFNKRVNFIYISDVWANANQVQDFSKLTNLVPKASLIPKTIEKK